MRETRFQPHAPPGLCPWTRLGAVLPQTPSIISKPTTTAPNDSFQRFKGFFYIKISLARKRILTILFSVRNNYRWPVGCDVRWTISTTRWSVTWWRRLTRASWRSSMRRATWSARSTTRCSSTRSAPNWPRTNTSPAARCALYSHTEREKKNY